MVWSFADIPDQAGRTVVVTGANSGIGFETARMLALRGADVILACRRPDKGTAALERIRAERPPGSVTLELLDLSDLDSVAAFATAFALRHDRLDLLVNNAGVMVPPLGRTKQGFELQLGTNHLGHFALVGRLLPLARRTPRARIVVVSSIAQHVGRIDFDDLNWRRRPYRAARAYAQSKLANMLFALELHRRLSAAGAEVRATAAHPGWTATELQRTAALGRRLNPLFAMKPSKGALPTLRAATDPEVAGGSYWGPSRFFELNGPPAAARISPRARDEAVAARLWEVSEQLTGVSFALPAPSGSCSGKAGRASMLG
jgi:NAD(P)-dependent dehydrogenase (short-subunit alcohol dehydrogenase family)